MTNESTAENYFPVLPCNLLTSGSLFLCPHRVRNHNHFRNTFFVLQHYKSCSRTLFSIDVGLCSFLLMSLHDTFTFFLSHGKVKFCWCHYQVKWTNTSKWSKPCILVIFCIVMFVAAVPQKVGLQRLFRHNSIYKTAWCPSWLARSMRAHAAGSVSGFWAPTTPFPVELHRTEGPPCSIRSWSSSFKQNRTQCAMYRVQHLKARPSSHAYPKEAYLGQHSSLCILILSLIIIAACQSFILMTCCFSPSTTLLNCTTLTTC